MKNTEEKYFLPYAEITRANYLQCEGWEPGDKVEEEHLWVNWQDGHGPGLKAITLNEQMDIDASLKVLTNMQVVLQLYNKWRMLDVSLQ